MLRLFGNNNKASRGLTAKQRRALVVRHRDSCLRHGYSPDTLFWSSRGIQKARFRVIGEIGIGNCDSVLDVGCGFGDLHSWLAGNGRDVCYTGIDISAEILQQGQQMNPQLLLLCGELFDFDWPPASFDWVVLSGTLNWKLGDDGEYARNLIERMYSLCRKGVAFNMLDGRKLDNSMLGELMSHDPAPVLEYCRELSPNCRFRDDYLDNDFTVYLYREFL